MGAKSQAEKYNNIGVEAGRGESLTSVDPKGLVLITDPKDPLFDPRVNLPIDPKFVEDIRLNGVKQPVKVRWDGEKPVVIYGLQRVKTARFINENLKKWKDQQPILVPVLHFKGSVEEALLDNARENAQRKDETIFTKAFKAKRLIDRGVGQDKIVIAFGVEDFRVIERWMEVLNFHPEVQKAFDLGVELDGAVVRLQVTHIDAFSKLSADKQPELLKTIQQTGIKKSHQVKAAADAVKKGETFKPETVSAKMMGRPQLERLRDGVKGKLSALAAEMATKDLDVAGAAANAEARKKLEPLAAMLDYVLGNEKALTGHPDLQGIVVEALAPR